MVACRKRSVEFITDEAKRRSTFKKRKQSVFKKARELSTLCGIKTCVVVYSPDEPRPETWPSNQEAMELFQKFNQLSDEKKKNKMTDSDKILKKPVEKLQKELQKIESENRELKMELVIKNLINRRCDVRDLDLGVEDLQRMMYMVDLKLKKVNERMDEIGSSSKSDVIDLENGDVADLGDGHVAELRDADVAEGPRTMQLFPMTAIRDEKEEMKKKGEIKE